MSSISFRELESYDYPALAAFNSLFEGDGRSENEWLDRFKYWWDDNPAYDESWKRGFLLLDDENIVGFVGSFPTLFKHGNSVKKAFNGTTWRVLPAYRKYSIDLWTYNREVSKHHLSFNTTPTDDVIKMIKRLKYFRHPWGKDCYSYVIANAKEYGKMLPKKYPQNLRLAMAQGMKLWQSIRLRKKFSGLCVRDSLIHAEDIDDLWQRTKDQFAFSNVRDSKAVNWYRKGKEIRYIYQDKKLVAYAIYIKSIHSKSACSIYNCVDFWYESEIGLSDIFAALIHYDRARISKQSKIAMIRYHHFSKDVSNSLVKLPLFMRQSINTGYLRLANGYKVEFNNDNSYFTLLQGDTGA